jgi:aspartate/methionine/tyrosine aminotransferase
MTLLRPGDEIIMFEPFFELYLKQIAVTGAKPVFVPMQGRANDCWGINVDQLKRYSCDIFS